ncbi:MAG: hypothetical protein M5U28_35190 [Sandaracinaceae bacterium]|nr:hypothetical protein [Sandaracinaceae bacterium]
MPSSNPNPTASEAAIIQQFVDCYFGGLPATEEPTATDRAVVSEILAYVDERFGRMKYILGLAIDFAVLAQEVSRLDSRFAPQTDRDASAVLAQYPPVAQRGERQANTLSLTVGGTAVGIRKIEERVASAFHAMERSKYPSAYVYNTGQWKKYTDLLGLCFALSGASARRLAVQELFAFGLRRLERNAFFGRERPRPRIFEEAVLNFPREANEENGGLAFQAIVFGFLRADHQHLEWIADKVRTGSARQRRFGDIDGYAGLNLELSAEVKDLVIHSTNKQRQLGGFLQAVTKQHAIGMVFARSFDSDVRVELEGLGIVLTDSTTLSQLVKRWDWVKQDIALQSMVHYLAHIEQNASAVTRILAFITERDEHHPCLV